MPALYFAGLHAALGDRQHAETWSDKAFRERSGSVIYIRTDPKFDALRALPRFRQLMRPNGLRLR